MRAREILESAGRAEIPPGAQETMPPSITVPDMDQYYEFYRFMVGIAGEPDREIPIDGPVADGAVIAPYTKQELDHVLKVIKRMGKTAKFITKKPSIEPESTNTVSPVRKFVDYGRGS
jgi:hypothetical protein